MAEDASMPDWIAKTLSVLSALSGWVLLALAIAPAVILFAPTPGGVNLELIRREWGGWIYFGGVVAGLLTLARFAQWVIAKHEKEKQGRPLRMLRSKQRAAFERDVLAQLNNLSQSERLILQHLVEKDQRTIVDSHHDIALEMLRAKGLVEASDYIRARHSIPYTVPDFVWAALLARRDELFLPPAPKPQRRGLPPHRPIGH